MPIHHFFVSREILLLPKLSPTNPSNATPKGQPSPIMSDDEGSVELQVSYQVLPKDVTEEAGSVKLFNKWSYEDVEIRDISLT